MRPKRKSPDLFEVIAQQGRDIKKLQAALARISIVTTKTTTGDLIAGADWGSFNHWQAGELSAAGPGSATGTFDYWQAGEVHPFITTGSDSVSGYEGQVVINTFDNNIKQYAEGAWRTLASW